MAQPPQPVPPASPLLASTLLTAQLNKHAALISSLTSNSRCSKTPGLVPSTPRLQTTVKEIDDYVLDGGLERGVVVGVSGILDSAAGKEGRVAGGAGGGHITGGVGVGAGGDDGGHGEGAKNHEPTAAAVPRILALTWLVDALLKDGSAKAVIVDTTGGFEVRLLAGVTRWRVAGLTGDQERDDEVVRGILERVAIERVFDIEGLWEVVGEVGRECEVAVAADDDEGGDGGEDVVDLERDDGVDDVLRGDSTGEEERRQDGQGGTHDVPPSLEIGDSQEDDEDDDDLDNINAAPPPPPRPAAGSTTTKASELAKPPPSEEGPNANPNVNTQPNPKPKTTPTILFIDNITSLLSAHLSTHSKSTSHALFTSLSSSLHNLTHTHSLVTILLNSLTFPFSSASSSKKNNHHKSSSTTTGTTTISHTTHATHANYNYNHNPYDIPPTPNQKASPSIFSAVTARPALGKTIDDMLDLHVLVSKLPRGRVDAEALYAGVSPATPSLHHGRDPQGHAREDGEQDQPPSYLHLHQPEGRGGMLYEYHDHSRNLEHKHHIEYAHVVEILKDEGSDVHLWERRVDDDDDGGGEWVKQMDMKDSEGEVRKRRKRRRKDRHGRWCAVRPVRFVVGGGAGGGRAGRVGLVAAFGSAFSSASASASGTRRVGEQQQQEEEKEEKEEKEEEMSREGRGGGLPDKGVRHVARMYGFGRRV